MKPVLVIHGGAGRLSPAQNTPEARAPFEEGMQAAIDAGMAVLKRGGPARDAVIEAVAALEDNPLFNAGRGSVLCRNGTVECCASTMCGETGHAGASCLLRRVRNPVRLAKVVFDHEHTLIAGKTAETLAEEAGLEMVAPSWFVTKARRAQWNKFKDRDETVLDTSGFDHTVDAPEHTKGTVGAVALDRKGRLAAATSTGGLVNQLPGRIGDSPVIGAGTWADQNLALSATGDGDIFARLGFARRVADLVDLRRISPLTAAKRTLAQVAEHGGEGGCIIVDRSGRIFAPHNSPHMNWKAGN